MFTKDQFQFVMSDVGRWDANDVRGASGLIVGKDAFQVLLLYWWLSYGRFLSLSSFPIPVLDPFPIVVSFSYINCKAFHHCCK